MAVLRHDDARERRAHLAVEPALGPGERLGRGRRGPCRRGSTAADFPPSSSVHRAIRSPHSDAMRRPAAVDPVNVILSTPGSRTSSSDTSRSAVTTLSTPGGRPICSADLGEHVALARRLRRRLEHDGAAGEERGADLVADERDRRVPRDDRADDADRLAHEQAELAAARRRALLLERERVGQRGVRRERTRADPPGVLRRLVEHARLARPQLREHVAALLRARRRARGCTRRAPRA